MTEEILERLQFLLERRVLSEHALKNLAEGKWGNVADEIIVESEYSDPAPRTYLQKLLQLLIETGLDVNKPNFDHIAQQDDEVYTLLGRAVSVKSPELVQTLLDAGADPMASYGEALRLLINAGDGMGPRARKAERPIATMLLRAGSTGAVRMLRPAQLQYLFDQPGKIWRLFSIPIELRRQIQTYLSQETEQVLSQVPTMLAAATSVNLASYLQQAL